MSDATERAAAATRIASMLTRECPTHDRNLALAVLGGALGWAVGALRSIGVSHADMLLIVEESWTHAVATAPGEGPTS
jgi:hypothetical protein